MRQNDFTLGEIISKTGLSKTTIYHHIKNMPKSGILVEKIRNASRINQKIQADRRRGKSVKTYTFLRPKKWTTDFVRLIAHFLFDGTIGRASCNYNNRSRALIDGVIGLMEKAVGVTDYKIYSNLDGVIRVSYNNVELAGFIKEKAEELLPWISTADLEYKQSFLRTFFDDEGCASFRPHRNARLVRGYQHNTGILKLVHDLLIQFGIQSKVDTQFYEIVISRRNNITKFAQSINFSPNVFINGNRSNSIWKKSLEKREILRMALASYQS